MTNTELFINNIESCGLTLSELGFSKGASDEQINEVEKSVKKILPDDFKLFLRKINGQSSDKLFFLPDEALLFSCQEIIAAYNGLAQYVDDSIECYNEYQYKDKIRCTVWSESRIPIAGRDGYYLFLDFDPGPKGTKGQVIFLINECDFVVLAPSFDDFLFIYNENMKSRVLQVREILSGQASHYRLTTHADFLNGQEFADLFGH